MWLDGSKKYVFVYIGKTNITIYFNIKLIQTNTTRRKSQHVKNGLIVYILFKVLNICKNSCARMIPTIYSSLQLMNWIWNCFICLSNCRSFRFVTKCVFWWLLWTNSWERNKKIQDGDHFRAVLNIDFFCRGLQFPKNSKNNKKLGVTLPI